MEYIISSYVMDMLVDVAGPLGIIRIIYPHALLETFTPPFNFDLYLIDGITYLVCNGYAGKSGWPTGYLTVPACPP